MYKYVLYFILSVYHIISIISTYEYITLRRFINRPPWIIFNNNYMHITFLRPVVRQPVGYTGPPPPNLQLMPF